MAEASLAWFSLTPCFVVGTEDLGGSVASQDILTKTEGISKGIDFLRSESICLIVFCGLDATVAALSQSIGGLEA